MRRKRRRRSRRRRRRRRRRRWRRRNECAIVAAFVGILIVSCRVTLALALTVCIVSTDTCICTDCMY